MPNSQAKIKSKNKLGNKNSKSSKLPDALHRIKKLESEISSVILVMQGKVRQLEFLNDFSRIIHSVIDLQSVRNKTLEATCSLLRCEKAALFLVDHKKGELYWNNSQGTQNEKFKIPIDSSSIEGYVTMTGEGILINHLQKVSHYKISHYDLKDQSLICIPLKTKNQTIGVLVAFNKLSTVPVLPSQHAWPDFHEEDKKLLESLSHQVSLAIENSSLHADIKKSFFDTVEALAEAIEKKDHYTGGHTKRVAHYAVCIAKYLPLSAEQMERVRLGAILHDVGKIGIEDKILKKDAPLDSEEWKVMKTHPNLGFDIMSRVEGLKEVVGGMRYHHERWDGSGYPLGLKAEEIPMIARIIALADAYDAMVSNRPYRKGISPQEAYNEIVQSKGTQFAPEVVEAFQKAYQLEKMGQNLKR